MYLKFIFIAFVLLLTLSLQAQYMRGVFPEEDTEYANLPKRAPLVSRAYSVVPQSFSLRKFAPLPQSQENHGNCTGWAAAYSARTILEAQKENWTDIRTITNNAFSPGFTFLEGGGKGENCLGAFTTGVVRSLAIHGAIRGADMLPEKGTSECPQFPIDVELLRKAQANRISFPLTLWDPGYQDTKVKIARAKRAISAGHPIVISMVVPNSFMGVKDGGSVGPDGHWTPATQYPTAYDRETNCHAMTVIGFDDNRFGGSFEVQNSWGRNWGDQGYGWINYEDFARYCYQAFEVFLEPAKERNWTTGKQQLAGKLRLFDYGQKRDLPVELAAKTRNWSVGSDNGDYTYKITEKLMPGIKMQLFLESDQPAFVYLLGTGSADPRVNLLFPQPGFSAAMNYKNYEVALPSEDNYFTDNSTGTNNLLLLYSATELDIDIIINQLNQNSSRPISERLDATIRDLLIDPNDITFAQDGISFEAAIKDERKAFALILRSEHGG